MEGSCAVGRGKDTNTRRPRPLAARALNHGPFRAEQRRQRQGRPEGLFRGEMPRSTATGEMP
jgi:hypothetical protein